MFTLIDQAKLRTLAVEQDAAHLSPFDRLDLELTLDLAVWLDLYSPTLQL